MNEQMEEVPLLKPVEEIHHCRRCNRKLKSEQAIKNGMGIVCYRRYLAEQAHIPKLFEVVHHEQ